MEQTCKEAKIKETLVLGITHTEKHCFKLKNFNAFLYSYHKP